LSEVSFGPIGKNNSTRLWNIHKSQTRSISHPGHSQESKDQVNVHIISITDSLLLASYSLIQNKLSGRFTTFYFHPKQCFYAVDLSPGQRAGIRPCVMNANLTPACIYIGMRQSLLYPCGPLARSTSMRTI